MHPIPVAWQLVRQDDNGNRYVVAVLEDERTARDLAASLEARGHKQLYEVRRMLGACEPRRARADN